MTAKRKAAETAAASAAVSSAVATVGASRRRRGIVATIATAEVNARRFAGWFGDDDIRAARMAERLHAARQRLVEHDADED